LLTLLPNIISYMKEVGMIYEWMRYLRLLNTRELPLNNIAHLLFLDVCRWYSCENTVTMKYSHEIKQFWLLGYRIFHGKFLRYMCGIRHTGDVKTATTSKSMYSPSQSNINFAVPDIKILAASASIKSSEMKPGLLPQMLDIFMKDEINIFKLCVDGKKLNISSTQVNGEVNLFGFEDKPTFNESRDAIITQQSWGSTKHREFKNV